MLRRFALSVSVVCFAAASPAVAGRQPTEDTIVVTGTNLGEQEVRKRARVHTRAVLASQVGGQNARWSRPLCVSAMGVQPSTVAPLVARIEEVATRVGARVANAGCTPNVAILFTANADAAFAAIESQRSYLLANTLKADREKLRTPGLPVRWFYAQVVEGAGGRQINHELPGLLGRPGIRQDGDGRMSSPAQVSITTMIALVDVPRAAGVSLATLGDYLAFAVLSRSRVDVPPGSDSILSLFQPTEGAPPDAMTALDIAFLKALYTVPITRTAGVHRGSLTEAMVKDLSKPVP